MSVFEAAGWDHDGEAGVSTQQWDRDPIGVEVTLNEADARAGRISAGVGALINVVRQLGLVYDNTIYMNDDVPSGAGPAAGRQEAAEMNARGRDPRPRAPVFADDPRSSRMSRCRIP